MRLFSAVKAFILITGLLAIAFTASAATGFHNTGIKWLSSAEYAPDCDYILLLPAGPVPNPSTLLRSYKAAAEYRKNPEAKVIISHKTETGLEKSTLWGIRKELILRGVPETSIFLETKARNTGEHAKYIKEAAFGDLKKDKYLLVTSPTHIKRSVMVFRAAGFNHVYAVGSKRRPPAENLGDGQFFRYNLWYSMMSEIEMFREFVAIAYYKITGRA